MKRLAWCLVLCTSACGAQAEPSLGLIVRMDRLLADEARSLTLFALAPLRTDGIFLTCSELLGDRIEPTDSRVEAYDRADVAFVGAESRSVTLDNIPPGNQRIVYGVATDAQSRTIAQGCSKDIVIEEGATAEVELVLFSVP